MIEINKSLHGAKGKIKAVYLGTTPVVMYLGDQLLYDVDLDGEYVLMDIQDGDTVDSTIEAPVKSAILKGQTLVNLYQSKTAIFIGEGIFNVNKDRLIENKQYTLFYEVKENNDNKVIFVDHMQSNKRHPNNSYYIESSIGSHKELLTFKKQENYETNFNWWVRSDSSQATVSIDNIILLEGDYTNVDIPYFNGMQSVKMPVLTTAGKNLFDKTKIIFNKLLDRDTGKTIDDDKGIVTDFIKVIPNTKYTMSFDLNTAYWTRCFGFTEPKEYMFATDVNGINDKCYFDSSLRTITFTTSPTTKYIKFSFGTGVQETFQFEQGTVATTYEPYKSNILTVNEEVSLRGIGDVKDTLDCLTGEVTERIGEIVLDGSNDEAWRDCNPTNDSVISFLLVLDGKQNSSNFTNNKMINKPTWDASVEGIWADCNIILTFKRSTLTTNDLTGARQWLSQNPITVQYQLSIESVKTVDLTIQDQDNKIISTLNTFNDTTHFTVQGKEGKLQPVVSMEIACNPSQAISELSDKTEQLQQEQQELTEQVEQQEQDTNNLQTATTDLEEV